MRTDRYTAEHAAGRRRREIAAVALARHVARAMAWGPLIAGCLAGIGVMIALRRGSGPIAVWTAAAVAALFSLAIEFGRWFKPDLQPDFSNAIIAAIGAGFAVRFMDVFWRMLEGVPIAAMTRHRFSPATRRRPR